MPVREIVTIGNPVLRKRGREVDSDELNPVIEPLDGELVETNEGCLSVPHLRGVVNRHVSIRIRYLDRYGQEHDESRLGVTAGSFQHEVDHLDGTLIVHRADPRTLMSWNEFDHRHHDKFVARIADLVERFGS